MELTIDEKMQLVQKMRAQEAVNTPLRYPRQYAESSRGAGAQLDAQRPGRFSVLIVRIVISLCLFGGYIYLHYGHGSISGIKAEDVSMCISANGLWPGQAGEK